MAKAVATSVAAMDDVAVRVKPPTVTLSPDSRGLNVTVDVVEVGNTPAVVTGAVAAAIVVEVVTSLVLPAVTDVKTTLLLDAADDFQPDKVPEKL